jgi:hypothetical protein
VAELVAVAVSVRDDLLLRSEIDSDGTRCVNLSASKWSSFCDVIDDNNSGAFITRKQTKAVQASRHALSSCSENPNSSDHASRQGVEGDGVRGYSYELARSIENGKYCDFALHISRQKPSVPVGSIRNLEPLYTHPASEATGDDQAKADERISVHEYTARMSLEALKFYTEWMQRNDCGEPEPIEHFYAMQAIEEIESLLPEPPKQEEGQ